MFGIFIRLLLSNHPDSLSSTRFSFLLCVIISNLSIFLVWSYMSILEGHMVDIPESVIILYCLANGIIYTGKLFQKNIEVLGNSGTKQKTHGDRNATTK